MEKDSNQTSEKKKENLQDKANQWVDKAEAFIDGAAEDIHKSDTYRKADQSVEKVTKLIFRKAGKWWGKFGK